MTLRCCSSKENKKGGLLAVTRKYKQIRCFIYKKTGHWQKCLYRKDKKAFMSLLESFLSPRKYLGGHCKMEVLFSPNRLQLISWQSYFSNNLGSGCYKICCNFNFHFHLGILFILHLLLLLTPPEVSNIGHKFKCDFY